MTPETAPSPEPGSTREQQVQTIGHLIERIDQKYPDEKAEVSDHSYYAEPLARLQRYLNQRISPSNHQQLRAFFEKYGGSLSNRDYFTHWWGNNNELASLLSDEERTV